MSALSLLWNATIALTATTLVVLAMRPLLRARLGAELAYAAWLAVPLAALATLLPGSRVATPLAGAMPSLPSVAVPAPAANADGVAWPTLVLGAWLLGALVTLALFVRQQRRYVRSLALDRAAGQRVDGVLVVRARSEQASPATIGALHPCIALPADFELRYDATECELVLAHERMHVARGDGLANAVLAALRCAFWFDPVLHFAARRFRFDQELACDAAVLRDRPGARRAYAEAIFKTQLAVPGLPVGCHWQSSRPLKERILMLKKDRATRTRLGGAATALFIGLVTLSSYATQADGTLAATKPAVPDVEPTFAKLVSVSYPKAALDERQQGNVTLKLHIGADGRVLEAIADPDLAQPALVLQEAAVAGVKEWTFNPARRAGEPVDAWVRVPITFSLDEEAPAATDDDGLDAIRVMPEAQPH